MVVKCVENFLQPFEKKFQPKKGGFVRKSQPVLNPMFFKNQDIFTFPGIKSDWFVVWSWFLYWRKELVWADLPNTLNMVVKCVENFLQPFEKIVSTSVSHAPAGSTPGSTPPEKLTPSWPRGRPRFFKLYFWTFFWVLLHLSMFYMTFVHISTIRKVYPTTYSHFGPFKVN